MVGQCTAEGLGDWFAKGSTQASSNYGIGKDGRIGLYVEEKNRSWCSSSNANDQRAVTIECASDTAEPYAFRDVVYQRLVELCTDICRRNNRDEIYRFSEELLVMEKGRAAVFGKSREIFDNPENVAAARLTGCKNISRVKVTDKHHMEALDFGIMLHTEREIPEGTAAVGFRAHEFIPVWGKRQENCIKVQVESMAELPFEHQYYLSPEPENEKGGHMEKGSGEKLLCWFVQKDKWARLREKGLPDYLRFAEDQILFLKE